ncbi:MAG: aminotransferase class I/II-fold pyridoxal phosphate-dependent enzyme [Bryobacteraceae bacterium]
MQQSRFENSYMKWLATEARRILPRIQTIQGSPTDPHVAMGGRGVVLMCSPNYLGLANDAGVVRALRDATTRYGAGTVGSGILSGYTEAHRQVEQDLAWFMNEESAIFYNAVSDASAGVIAAVVNPPLLSILDGVSSRALGSCAVFFDRENHASLLDAVRLARPGKVYVYRHCDADHLRHLVRRSSHQRKLVVTDGYFSMSARVAPLGQIAEICDESGAMLLVDDAHGTGVFGENGRGTPEMLGVEDRVDFWIGSTAKALGVRGGYIAGQRELMDYLRASSRRYVFSGTLPAGIPAAVSEALWTARRQPWRRQRVQSHAAMLRRGLAAMGCDVMGEGHIVPWYIGDDHKVDHISHVLLEHGIFASAIRFPAVAKGEARIRFMPMASHSEQHIAQALEACQKVCKGALAPELAELRAAAA